MFESGIGILGLVEQIERTLLKDLFKTVATGFSTKVKAPVLKKSGSNLKELT